MEIRQRPVLGTYWRAHRPLCSGLCEVDRVKFALQIVDTPLHASNSLQFAACKCLRIPLPRGSQSFRTQATQLQHLPRQHNGTYAATLTYLLTYSMVQSPSWEANWFAASQEIPRISRNPKVHYRTHKRPPPVSILGQPDPVHIPTSHLHEIHPNIIHPSTPRSPQWSLSLRFLHQDPILCSHIVH